MAGARFKNPAPAIKYRVENIKNTTSAVFQEPLQTFHHSRALSQQRSGGT